MPTAVFISIGAISAAFITGIFTFVALVLAKDHKTSEFRQEWIDCFRDELSDFIGMCSSTGIFITHIHKLIANDSSFSKREDMYFEKQQDLLMKLIALRAKLLLRINPEEHKIFVERLEDAYDLVKDGTPCSSDVARPVIQNLTEEGQRLLKYEWKRVKKGESSFRNTKYLALACVILVAMCIAATVWQVCNGTFPISLQCPSSIMQ